MECESKAMEEENIVSVVRSIGRSLSRAAGSLGIEDVFSISSGCSHHSMEDEEALRWAALEKLSTYDRLRTTIFKHYVHVDQQEIPTDKMLLDVRELDPNAQQQFIDQIFKVTVDDNGKFLKKFRDRVDKVGISLPTIEVRFQNLTIEADCHIGDRALPSLPNAARNIMESLLDFIGIHLYKKTKLAILKDVSGIIKPSRMTLLLGPPSSGKTTLLMAMSGKHDSSLKVEGEITYNGHKLCEFVPQRTSSYISQNDVHVGEMTVKETLDFSARCQGVGSRLDLLAEIARREKQARIFPDADVDLFMKATAIEGDAINLITYYTLRILGLDVCSDTIVGNAMRRGISGGQKKRVTTGEMLVGPAKTLFMDEISTGLDSSTTFQIVKCLQQVVHLTESTITMSLLQPDTETFDLFDDVILLSEGQIVYQGPRENALEFFESCGFMCPERKGIADFLQEVTSRKDQEQYWADRCKSYRYIPVSEFVQRFKSFHVGEKLKYELKIPYNKNQSHDAAVVFKKYLVTKREMLKASWNKELLLLRRNASVYIFKSVQFIILAFIGVTLFIRTKMHTRSEDDGSIYNKTLLLSLIINMYIGRAEIAFTVARVPVIFKQRDLLFHPMWVYTLPTFLLRLPICLLDSISWVAILYYGVGLAPEASRFFKHFLLIFFIQNVGGGLFRLIAGVCRKMNIANTFGTLALLLIFLLGGFILPNAQIPYWLGWLTWTLPLSYGFKSLAINEFFAARWMNKISSDNVTSLGITILENMDVPTQETWYWIGVASLLGFALLFNVLFTFALMYLDQPEKRQKVIYKEADTWIQAQQDTNQQQRLRITEVDGSNQSGSDSNNSNGVAHKKGIFFPFTLVAMSFESLNYFVDMPQEMREQGVTESRLQLLHEVTGSFRPGVLTALMGVSGAGKTTLLDVLAGRKTGGCSEGDIRISGFPKKQETFARISGYCEQTDIHSPHVTVHESLIYSAFLRLPKEVENEKKMLFVSEVLELVELENIKDAIVGLPGVTGLSTEQRKRLTIAVELVANPSIIFMDEPTSGLDARAAAIVIRAVRNIVDTGRTVVCTIHQPSIDIFESFDELLLMKRGGLLVHLCLYFVCIRSVYKRYPKLVCKLTKSTILLV
ncbi:putative ABC-type xenobiotic transporter [Helianthus annuus]|nr:putative ABC-type xenobiotic transporter [Helianthus annuus]